MYGVQRADVIKSESDFADKDKRNSDFYDYILVDIHPTGVETFLLVNVTLDSSNKGAILCMFENVNSRGGIKAKIIKEYFDGMSEIFIVD